MPDKIPAVFLNSDGGYSAMSWNGFNVLGNRKSIDEVKRATNEACTIPQLRDRIKAYGDRIAELEALTRPRPMESAPRDGSRIWATVDGAVRVVAWGKTSHVPLYGFCLADQGAEDFDLCEPTEWWPMPEPSNA